MLAIIGASFWGLGGTVSDFLFQQRHIDVNWYVTTKQLISGVFLLTIFKIMNKQRSLFSIFISKYSLLELLIFSIFGMLIVQYSYMASINYGNAAVATLLQYIAPVYIIDMGPSSGAQGGEITFKGTYKELLSSDTSTGEALRIKHHLKNEIREANSFYHLGPVTQNNLNNVTVDIPKHVLTVLTGVAGSGKSSLVKAGFTKNDNAVFMDQKAIQGSDRSNLLTYLGVFDRVRNFFSKETRLNKSMFSYNSKGACPNCGGKGYIETELAFMGEFSQTCEVCHGKRYKPEVLNATIDGYSIADFLELTVDEGIRFFDKENEIQSKLQAISKTGLNYVTLGQPLSTLSGGEIQRVKLGQYLNDDVTDSIFIFDEPTTGLHEADIPILINCFNDLIEQNNTVILIEHNLSIMCDADWIIDVGPGPGLDGGKVQFSGYPINFVKENKTLTSKHLKLYIAND
ncbi:ATP-binding cassette domain-containing protein [Staphylococcus xylosus]|nr:ATP-binding cassette domain-containing protein [Staphylococcus xylosus]